jgi:VanZ family protein
VPKARLADRIVPLALGWLPAVLWAALIFRLSSRPATGLPGRFSSLAHFAFYLVLAVLVLRALAEVAPSRRAALTALVVASLYGITDEVHQSFVPGRTPDLVDWVLDTLGAAAGVWGTVYAKRAARRRPSLSSARDSGAAPHSGDGR